MFMPKADVSSYLINLSITYLQHGCILPWMYTSVSTITADQDGTPHNVAHVNP